MNLGFILQEKSVLISFISVLLFFITIILILKSLIRKLKIKTLFLIFSGICLIFFSYIYIEPFWVKVNNIEFKHKDIPVDFHNKKIIFISDIHHGPYLSINRVKKLVQKINKLKPDMILLGGDYVHRNKKYIKPCFKELKKLKAKFGVFGVLGNHDHWESASLTISSMKKAGINLVKNSGKWIYYKKSRIKIGGVGDLWEDTQIIKPIINDANINDFVILISHNPDYVEKVKSNKIDLVVSGHTHGGQVTLFGLWAPILPSKYGQKYRSGIKYNNNICTLITTGIGTITPPVRFFARPEIVLISLKRN